MNKALPQEVRACLWSYDVDKMDSSNPDHRTRIIKNVLNIGTQKAIDWLLDKYTADEIKQTLAQSSVSEWDKKSLSLWSIIFATKPARMSRFA